MVSEFKVLNEDEVSLMHKVPALVAVLIAGADNNIDKNEVREAISLSRLKQTKAREALLSYYQEIGNEFEDNLMELIKGLPADASKRNPKIIEELSRLNEILPKLDRNFAVKFYASIKDIAKKIAEASGGVLGYMSVGYEESKLIDLYMINDPS